MSASIPAETYNTQSHILFPKSKCSSVTLLKGAPINMSEVNMTSANLTPAEYDQCCDDLMLAIEEAIDQSGEDIDYEASAGVLTLTVEGNASKIIISRQPALQQIWVAAKSGGYYFNLLGNDDAENIWICTTTEETLNELLCRVFQEQEGGNISFDV